MAFISEIHYRTALAQSTGVAPYVEISVAPADLSRRADFALATYQGDGRMTQSTNLGGLTGRIDPGTGWTLFRIATPPRDPAQTAQAAEAAPALAFIDAGATPRLQRFIAIGGDATAMLAQDGPAVGQVPVTIPAATGPAIQFDVHGNRLDHPLTEEAAAICLTGGTLIDTPDGPRAIEELAIGDLVETWDGPPQPIRMIHSRTLSGTTYRTNRRLWPVCIQAGALGFGLPRRNLRVSPQHRMLYQHIRVPLLFGEDAVFVRAKSMAASFEEVYVDSSLDQITYFHLVFDRHEVIFAEGAATESFHPGAEGTANLPPAARAELYTIFPGLRVGSRSHDASFVTLRSWELMACVA